MKKIPPELVRLLKDQFQASPSALVTGIFADEKSEPEYDGTPSVSEETFDLADEEISDD